MDAFRIISEVLNLYQHTAGCKCPVLTVLWLTYKGAFIIITITMQTEQWICKIVIMVVSYKWWHGLIKFMIHLSIIITLEYFKYLVKNN